MRRRAAILLVLSFAAAPASALACPDCPAAQAVRASVFDERFWTNLFLVWLPLFALGAIAAARGGRGSHRRGVTSAGTVLGIGLGGFVDGILLHQILQWHNMLSSKVVPVDLVSMKYNMVWDGLFHAFTWIFTVVGIALLWRAGQRADVPWSTRTFVGSLLLGWGLFNVVEGLIDHQVLGLHHVHPGANQLAWDLGFLAFGAALIAGGWALIRAGRRDETPRGVRRQERLRQSEAATMSP